MTPDTSEPQTQLNTIALLKAMGYTFIPSNEMNQHRDNNNQVLLKNILLEHLQKLNGFEYKNANYKFSPKNLAKAISAIDEPLNNGLATANQKITDQLLLGNAYEEELIDGHRKSFTLKYIDFTNPENNVFHFTEEFIVSRAIKNEKEKTRRPDLVLFINGIPIGVIELKKSSVEISQGISQMIRNQKDGEIPHLFKFAQITLAGNNHSAKYGTTKTSAKFYSTWIEEQEQDLTHLINERMPTALDKAIFSLFEHHRLIKLMHLFILFDEKVKKIARYQQFFAIDKTIQTINTIDKKGKRKGGLIWHTQGSGKSLTMVMLVKVIKKQIPNSKIIVVTDRKDLDAQIHNTFKNSDIHTEKARSGHHLIELLRLGVGVITTVINKFETVKQENVVLQDNNIFVLIDESHRSQGGDMGLAMNRVLTGACYIGFTGTPLMKTEKSTVRLFGGEIHRYTIDQAVKDEAVLPLLYEGRLVDQWVNDQKGLDKRFDIISKDLNDEQKLDLNRKWARFQHIAPSERRLEMIMLDINKHFVENVRGTRFKGILATSSRYEAIKYNKLFKEEGDIKTAFVISGYDTRDGNYKVEEDKAEYGDFSVNDEWKKILEKYGDEDNYLNKVKDKFINSDEIDLLIVVDKLLTGFDAPRAEYLYIDKPLKEHSLLQAIARVNRLHEGKKYGCVIDYRGLLGDLDNALTSYSGLSKFNEEDIIGVVLDIKEEIAKVKTYYTYLDDLFSQVDNKGDQECYEVYLADETIRTKFYGYFSQFAVALKRALSSDKFHSVFQDDEINNFKKKMKFYTELRKSIKIRYFEVVDFSQYEPKMRKLLDIFLSADEVQQLTRVVDIFDVNFDAEVERLHGKNAKADAILSACSAVIKERKDSDPAYYEKLSKRIQAIIDEYREKRLTEEEKFSNAKEIKEILSHGCNDEDENYPQGIQDNRFAQVIYKNICEDFESLSSDNSPEIIAELALKIDTIFKKFVKKPDWQNNTDVQNRIKSDIQDLLWKIEDEFSIKLNDEELINKIRSILINNLS